MNLPLFLEFIFPISFVKLLPLIFDRWNSTLTRQYFPLSAKQYFQANVKQYFAQKYFPSSFKLIVLPPLKQRIIINASPQM